MKDDIWMMGMFNRKEFPEVLLRGKLLDGFILVFSELPCDTYNIYSHPSQFAKNGI